MSETCIDLAGDYGRQYRMAYESQASQWPAVDRLWLARIRCRYGFVGVQGGDRLYAFTDRPVIGGRLRRLPFVERAQGDSEVHVVFHVDHLDAVLAILQPYGRRQVLSEAQLAALAAGRRPFVRRDCVDNSESTAPESSQIDGDGGDEA